MTDKLPVELQELKENCQQLASLLNNPEFGLFTWNDFVKNKMTNIATILRDLKVAPRPN